MLKQLKSALENDKIRINTFVIEPSNNGICLYIDFQDEDNNNDIDKYTFESTSTDLHEIGTLIITSVLARIKSKISEGENK